MSRTSGSLPEFDRREVDAVVVEIITAENPESQQAAVDAISRHWRSSAWPGELVSASCFRSTDEKSVLTYSQWTSRAALGSSLCAESSILRPQAGWGIPGTVSPGPMAFELYRVVRGGAVDDSEAVPECFPAAVFPMAGVEAAKEWIDGLLAAEEEAEGEERDYPGAIAANFHVGLDAGSVLVLSEWASEKEAADHIDEVIEPLLEAAGGGDAGARYVHCLTLSGPGA
jgi:hypothetical protein